MLDQKQKDVLRGMICGFLAMLLLFGLSLLMRETRFVPPGMAVLKWDLLVALCLAGNIAIIARHRFFTSADIDGVGLSEGTAILHVYQATLQNTLEQAVLAFITHLLWVLMMPQKWRALVVAAAISFFVGRVFFWRGYRRGAGARSFGFALTFYPSLLMLLVMVAWIIVGPAPR